VGGAAGRGHAGAARAGGPRRLGVTSIRVALKAARSCTDDAIRSWGADPAAVVPYTPDLAARYARIVTNDHYPPEAIRSGQQGRLVTLTSISAYERPQSCSVVKSSGSTLLDRHSCGLVTRRLRLPPAPVGTVRWSVLPFIWELPSR
jgi:TonB family protein